MLRDASVRPWKKALVCVGAGFTDESSAGTGELLVRTPTSEKGPDSSRCPAVGSVADVAAEAAVVSEPVGDDRVALAARTSDGVPSRPLLSSGRGEATLGALTKMALGLGFTGTEQGEDELIRLKSFPGCPSTRSK